MWPLYWRCSGLLLHLTLLWTAGWSGANQPQPSTDAGAASEPQETLRLIVLELKAEMEPLISQLALRIDGLDSRLTIIDSRLNALDFRQDAFDASLDDHSSRIESAEAKYDSGLDTLTSQISSTEVRVDQLQSQVNSTAEKLDSGLDPLTTRLNFTDTKLAKLVSQANSTVQKLDSGLVQLTSRMKTTEVRLHQLRSQVNVTEDRLGSRVEELASQVNGMSAGQRDRLDVVTSRLDGLSSRLDDLANLTEKLHSPPRDCSELPAGTRSGIYQLRLERSQPPVSAFCDLETVGGGWTVIQRRKDIQPRQDFNGTWTDYREGFGDLNEEFWWGLENMWKLTGAEERQYVLRVNLADFEGGRRHATYSRFRVGSEADGFPLTVSGYSGNAGDSLSYPHNGQKFSTKDRDQDDWSSVSCAQENKGGWWFKSCYNSFLNGPYRSGGHGGNEGGVNWYHWKGSYYSLRETEMKIRPV